MYGIEYSAQGAYLRGGAIVPADAPDAAAREKTMAYRILRAHNTPTGDGKLHIRFDALISHDITYVSHPRKSVFKKKENPSKKSASHPCRSV